MTTKKKSFIKLKSEISIENESFWKTGLSKNHRKTPNFYDNDKDRRDYEKNVFLIFLRKIQTKFQRKTYKKLMEECIKNTKFALWPAVAGFEPSNLWLWVDCSTTVLTYTIFYLPVPVVAWLEPSNLGSWVDCSTTMKPNTIFPPNASGGLIWAPKIIIPGWFFYHCAVLHYFLSS